MESEDDSDPPFGSRPRTATVPLTALQRRMWNEPLRRLRVGAASVRVLGELDVSVLRTCLDALVQRHESLRTRIAVIDGVPTQQVDPADGCHLEVSTLGARARDDMEAQAKQLAQQFVEREIDPSLGPLFEGRILRLSPREHVLILALDHLVSDGVSLEILNKELWTLYTQAARGQSLSLPRLPIQFADYAVWLHRAHRSWARQHEGYWRARLSGACPIDLPVDEGLPYVAPRAGKLLHFSLDAALSARLRELARGQRLPVSLLVSTAYVATMSRWCDRRDLLLAFITHGRHRPELAGMIGFLANPVYLRLELGGEGTLIDLAKQIDHELRTASQHPDFGRVPDFLPQCGAALSFNWFPTSRLFKWLPLNGTFNWLPAHGVPSGEAEGDVLRLEPFASCVPRWLHFAPAFYDTATTIDCAVWYRPDLLAPGTMERFARTFSSFAQQVTVQGDS